MYFVGIDLAWGSRARTGVAVLSPDGRLATSGSVTTDDEICAFLSPYDGAPLLAAIDAPLVVVNEAGRRPCEADVQRLFGAFHAGPYPANLGNPCFAGGTRGARVAGRLGLDLDPLAASPRRAIEVYPHAAMVALFGLPRVIPYKNKRGRTLDDQRLAFGVLFDHIERYAGRSLGLARSERWAFVRARAAAAVRKSHLRAIEDEVDAIVCAVVARHWALHGEAGNHLLGDSVTGLLVTPRASR